jgi:DNA primase small subunit
MSQKFLQEKFKQYYSKNEIPAPPLIEQREFGVGVDKKIDSRHLSFANQEKLNFYLRSAAPLFISYSAGYYEFPEARPMENKNWKGADLVFDLDAHDTDVDCDHPHDHVCRKCMKQISIETSRLVNSFLKPDFGFSEDELFVFFSGNRGFHVHVRADSVKDLSPDARREIVEYVTAENIKLTRPGPGKQLLGPTVDTPGWGRKISLVLLDSLKKFDSAKEFSQNTQIKSTALHKIFKNKQDAKKALQTGVWSKVNWSTPKQTRERWDDLVRDVTARLRVALDKNVTTDTSRLMRLPGTLHGQTGFAAVKIKDLGSFNPFSDPVVFGDEPVKVKALHDWEFEVKENKYELKKDAQASLPECAAVYAIAKKMAEVVDVV